MNEVLYNNQQEEDRESDLAPMKFSERVMSKLSHRDEIAIVSADLRDV